MNFLQEEKKNTNLDKNKSSSIFKDFIFFRHDERESERENVEDEQLFKWLAVGKTSIGMDNSVCGVVKTTETFDLIKLNNFFR